MSDLTPVTGKELTDAIAAHDKTVQEQFALQDKKFAECAREVDDLRKEVENVNEQVTEHKLNFTLKMARFERKRESEGELMEDSTNDDVMNLEAHAQKLESQNQASEQEYEEYMRAMKEKIGSLKNNATSSWEEWQEKTARTEEIKKLVEKLKKSVAKTEADLQKEKERAKELEEKLEEKEKLVEELQQSLDDSEANLQKEKERVKELEDWLASTIAGLTRIASRMEAPM